MKNKSIFVCFVLLISSFIIGCKWQVPEKVSVRTNADYNFSAGNINMSLDEQLDIKKMMEGANLPANVKVYDYFPGEKDPNTQRYLIKVALAEIPLDLDSMMAQIDLTSNLKAMEFNKEFTIPEIAIPVIQQGISIPQELSDSLKYLPADKSITHSFDPINIRLNEILPANSIVKSCKVSEGELGIKIEGLNDDASYSVDLESTGGLAVSGHGTKTLNIPLRTATITSGQSSDISLKVALENVKSVNNLKIVITPKITKLESVVVDLGAGLKTEINENVNLPKEVTDIVSGITLGNSGFKVTYTNTLPGGNDISLKAKSVFLGLTETTKQLVAGSTNKTVEFMASGKKVKTTTPIDFNVSIGLPGQSSGGVSSEIVLKNIGMGATYKIGMNVEPVLNWTEVSVNPSALNSFTHAGSADLGIDLNKMLSDLGTNLGDKNLFTKLQIESLPVYVFCGKPAGIDAFNNLKFTATAELQLNKQPLKGGKILDNKEIAPVNSLPNFNVDNVVKDDMSTMTASAKVDLGPAFSSVISTPGALSVNYNVSAAGGSGSSPITIKKEQLKGVAKIALEAYIDLGLALKVPEKGITIDLSNMEAMKSFVGTDIFKGNGKSMKDQGYDAYMKAIKELSINAGVKSLPYASANPITMNMTSTVGDWHFELGAGKDFNVKLTNENISKLFEDSVNNPNCEFKINTMNVVLPGGTFSIPRAKNINTNLELRLVTDGTIKVWEKGAPSAVNGGN